MYEKRRKGLPLEWIKDLEWHENDEQTDASLNFSIQGIDGSFIKDIFDVDSLSRNLVRKDIDKVAHRFCDAVTVEDFGWDVRDVEFASGADKAIDVWADIHLAYDD